MVHYNYHNNGISWPEYNTFSNKNKGTDGGTDGINGSMISNKGTDGGTDGTGRSISSKNTTSNTVSILVRDRRNQESSQRLQISLPRKSE